MLTVAIPLALYFLVKRYVTSSEIVALSAASLFPLIESPFSVVRHRSLGMLTVIVLLICFLFVPLPTTIISYTRL